MIFNASMAHGLNHQSPKKRNDIPKGFGESFPMADAGDNL